MKLISPVSGKRQAKFLWYPPLTISQRAANYRKLRFLRSGVRSELPEDLINVG